MLFVIRPNFKMLDKKYFHLLIISSIIFLFPVLNAEASSNPNLFVSAENSQFDNHFSGSMVIEVVVKDPGIANNPGRIVGGGLCNLLMDS